MSGDPNEGIEPMDAAQFYGEDGRPDFAGFAAQLRAEARWSAQIHEQDHTGQARSDQKTLNELADHVESIGKRLGFL